MGAHGHDVARSRAVYHGGNCGPVLEHSRARSWSRGEGGTVNALMRSRRGPVQFFGCQESGHVITNCPHCAQGTSAPGSTLTYNWPSAPHQRTDTSVPDMACAMDVTRRL